MKTTGIAKGFKMVEVNLLKHPICFTYPSRVAMSAWMGHVPFAMYIVDVLRPKAIVELGTHYGISYCAFCQAVRELGLDTRCYAIDTWQGDAQAGFYGPEVLMDLEEHHNPLYGGFSRLIQSTFDEALDYFGNHTFDLLHIDGFHTYEAVKQDLEKWLPKMTDRGVVLFHDINVREREFGVWRFWEELKLKYPSFEFVHSHGLGVLGVGKDYPDELRALFNCPEHEAIKVRSFFSHLGARLEAAQEVQTLRPAAKELPNLQRQKQDLEEQLGQLNARVSEAQHQVASLTQNVQARDAQIHERQEQVIALTKQLEDLSQLVSEKEGLALEATKQSSLSLEKIDVLTRQLEEVRQLVSEKNAIVHEKDELLRENERRIGENLSELERLSQQIDQLTGQTRKQDALLGDRNVQLQARIRQAEEKQVQMQEQARQLERLTQELEQRNLKLQLVGVQLREVELRARAKEKELADLQDSFQATIDDFSNSGSYRLGRALTFPVRVMKRYFVSNGSEPASVSKGIDRVEDVFSALEPKNEAGTQERHSLIDSLNVAQAAAKATEIEAFPGFTQVLFDADWYVDQNQDVAQSGVDPLQHYLRLGAKEGRSPHPLFDPKFYLKTYPDAAIDGRNPLHHYLTRGWKRGYKPNPKFDPLFYVTMYPDIAEAGVEPLTHFVTEGLREGRAGCSEDISLEPFEAGFEIPRTPITDNSAFESDIKAIAFYLPQFHPIPENDTWWGTGFTEWTNVRRARPQFKDHHQPHVPSILDYYDLREPAVLEKQIQLARDYGIYGFCFYYYWFAGKVLLDLPVRRMLETGKPDSPFCICWANENWTRRWDGRESEILIAQQHSPDDDLAFLRNVQRMLLHKNYIRVDGKPLLVVYQPTLLPDAQATAARWRDYFRAQGYGSLFLATMQTFSDTTPPGEYGFDAVIQFPPHQNSGPVNCMVEEMDESFAGQIYDYNRTKWRYIDGLRELNSSRNIYPGVMPSWDNTARRLSKSSIWINASPESYYDWLVQVSNFLRRNRAQDDRLVFINAWNEWAEGCHLEPDQRLGHAWLNATRIALQSERDAS